MLDVVEALVAEVASAEIMPRFRRLTAADIASKSGPMDLVTVADEAAEAALTRGLQRHFPGCAVVGEEATTRDPTLLAQVSEAGLCFVVDPIDGTFNFASGLPLFGVIVAVVEQGRTTGAVIHDPVGRDTALARAGQGAWLRSTDGTTAALRVSGGKPLAEMGGTLSWKYFEEPLRSRVCTRLPTLGWAWDYRCAAHQYRLLAAGHCDFAVYNRTLPWDHAAGVLLHAEAGGYAARLDGQAYAAGTLDGGLICAPDQASWAALRQGLFAEDQAEGPPVVETVQAAPNARSMA